MSINETDLPQRRRYSGQVVSQAGGGAAPAPTQPGEINEDELPTDERAYNVTVTFPDSAITRPTGGGSTSIVTGPPGEQGPPGEVSTVPGPQGDPGPVGPVGPQAPEEIWVGPDTPTLPSIDLWFDPDAVADYATGPAGPVGPAGPPGLTWQAEWDPNATYITNDAVALNGESWRATETIPPGQALFTPSNSLLWMQASGFATNSWTSASVTPIVFTQPTANLQPALVPNFANGLPAVRFASEDFLVTTNPLLNQANDWLFSCVVKTLPSNGEGMVWMFGREATLQRRAFWASGTNGNVGFSGYDSNVLSSTPTTTPTIVTMARRSGTIAVYVNGSLISSGSPVLTAFIYNGFALGANVSGSEGWTGDLAELVGVTNVDTVLQQQIEGYLAWRYGLQGALPAGHPYKLAAPTVSTAPGEDARWSLIAAVGDVGATGPPGPTILVDDAAPASAIGIDGQFYIDTITNAMYGPKNESALGSPVSMIHSLTPTGDDGVGPYTLGTQFRCTVPGAVTAIYFWRNSLSIRTTRKVTLWHGSTQVATANSANEPTVGWCRVPLAAQVDLTPGQTYTVGYEVDKYSYGGSTPVSEAAELTWVSLCYGPVGQYPATVGGGSYLADVEFREAGEIWPLVLTDGVSAVATHEAKPDPHPQYWTRWAGTQAQYNAIAVKNPNTLYAVSG